jgi:hypothetical protein
LCFIQIKNEVVLVEKRMIKRETRLRVSLSKRHVTTSKVIGERIFRVVEEAAAIQE